MAAVAAGFLVAFSVAVEKGLEPTLAQFAGSAAAVAVPALIVIFGCVEPWLRKSVFAKQLTIVITPSSIRINGKRYPLLAKDQVCRVTYQIARDQKADRKLSVQRNKLSARQRQLFEVSQRLQVVLEPYARLEADGPMTLIGPGKTIDIGCTVDGEAANDFLSVCSTAVTVMQNAAKKPVAATARAAREAKQKQEVGATRLRRERSSR